MLRAMDSAVAGLRSHQNKMDVVGHNISNVNTFGFKAQTYTFKEAMYQTSTPSTGGGQSGGVNAAQYGYGTLMGSIGMDMTASTPSYVGGFNATIDGDGFFITKSTKGDEDGVELGDDAATMSNAIKGSEFQFTRVGQFFLDSCGYVVDANGNFVYGFRWLEDAKDDDPIKYDTEALRPLRIPLVGDDGTPTSPIVDDEKEDGASQSVTIEINQAGIVSATVKYENAQGQMDKKTVTVGKVAIATFQNPNGVTKAGGSYYTTNKTDNTGLAVAAGPGEAGTATLMTGFLEASNVDLAKEFSDMIVTHRGFQANTKMITVSDEMLSDLVAMKR